MYMIVVHMSMGGVFILIAQKVSDEGDPACPNRKCSVRAVAGMVFVEKSKKDRVLKRLMKSVVQFHLSIVET